MMTAECILVYIRILTKTYLCNALARVKKQAKKKRLKKRRFTG